MATDKYIPLEIIETMNNIVLSLHKLQKGEPNNIKKVNVLMARLKVKTDELEEALTLTGKNLEEHVANILPKPKHN